MQEKEMFTLSEVQKKLDVENLGIIKEQLKEDLSRMLESCGLYFRIFSRVKQDKSLKKKMDSGKYGLDPEDRKIQDLIGIRIVLYYADDVKICQEMIDNIFIRCGEWERTNKTEDEFKAAKRNGVFYIPKDFLLGIADTTWELPVDKTFEVQLRTMFFEGWHEVEHDMRYKDLKNNRPGVWEDNEESVRVLNSILASLELCDWSLVNIFDKLADSHYKNKKWELMIRSKFRLRIDDLELSLEVGEILNENPQIAEQLYNCNRRDFLMALMRQNIKTKITCNLIVKIWNDYFVQNETLQKILFHTSESDHTFWERRFEIQPLRKNTAFGLSVDLRHQKNVPLEEEFKIAAEIVYDWIKTKYRDVFPNLKEEISNCNKQRTGFSIQVDYDLENLTFLMITQHIDSKSPGTIWSTKVAIGKTSGSPYLHMFVRNSYESPQSVTYQKYFSKPVFVDEIMEKIGLIDEKILKRNPRIMKDEMDLRKINELILNINRKLPLVVIAANGVEKNKDGQEKDQYLIQRYFLAHTICSYVHVVAIPYSMLEQCPWNERIKEKGIEVEGSVTVFYPGNKDMKVFTREDILEFKFDYNRGLRLEEGMYEKAFRHYLVQLLRDINIEQ